MADTKISGLTAVSVLDVNDMIPVVDIDDTTMASTGTDKRLTPAQLFAALTGDVTFAGFAGTITAGAVSYSKIQTVGASSLLGNPTGSGAAVSPITLGTNLSFAGSVLNATGGGGGTVNAGTTGQVAYYASSSTAVSGQSLSALIDAAIGSTQGGTLYRGASTWSYLAPGTIGQFLQSQGAAANPLWATPSGSGTVTSIIAGAGLTGGTITTTGTFALANPSTSTLGGVRSLAAVTHNFLTSISTSGVPTQAQPAFTDISGTAAAAQLPTTGLTITQSNHAIAAPADGATINFDLSTDNFFAPAALAGNRALTLSNAPASTPWASPFTVILLQDGTGSRTISSWFSGFTVLWAGGSAPTLTTTAAKRDTFCFIQIAATTLLGFVVGQNS